MYSVPPDYNKSYCLSDGYPKICNKLQKFESKGLISILDEAGKNICNSIFFGGVGEEGIHLISVLQYLCCGK